MKKHFKSSSPLLWTGSCCKNVKFGHKGFEDCLEHFRLIKQLYGNASR